MSVRITVCGKERFPMDRLKRKIGMASAIYTFDMICLVLFVGVLKWI